MIEILISGILGKMGSTLLNYTHKIKGIKTTYGIDRINTQIDDVKIFDNFFTDKIKVDAIVDFSSPDNVDNIINYSKINKTPCILCTTGYNNLQQEKINKASKMFPIFISSNMSYGVNAILNILNDLSYYLNDYDCSIIETHHKNKKDTPSGTAKSIYNFLRNNIDKKIDIFSLRHGDIIGEHDIIFTNKNEQIKISHQALNRDVFCEGVIKSLYFIVEKQKGLYTFKDIFNERHKG